MKKYIGLIAFWLILSTQAHTTEWTAENCTNRGGIILSGNLNGTFCASNTDMNWWSANVWCQRHGGQLADVSNACPGTPLNDKAACANFSANGAHPLWVKYSWLTNMQDTSTMSAWAIRWSGNPTTLGTKTVSNVARAFCE